MKEYYKYIKDVQSGKILTSIYIKQQVERLEKLKNRKDIYFDEECVQKCFDFISIMKHYSGKSAGKNFTLLPWQKWVIGSIIGIKWKETGYRVCRETQIMVARKQGKSSLIAALALYLLIMDGEANPSIGCVASTRDQARLIFEMIGHYAASIDPTEKQIIPYRNYIKFPKNLGEIKVYSSDSSKLDGLNQSATILDEGAVQKTNELYSVMKSSMGFRTQPLMIQISTAGFLTEGYPFFELYKVAVEILAGIKTQDEFFPFLYTLDADDEWDDEKNWIKSNPSLGDTVTLQYLKDQVQAAKNDATQTVPVKTKNLNVFCQGSNIWVSPELVVKCMKPIDWESLYGCNAYLGVDLSSVSDLTSLSLMVPWEGKYYFNTWTYLPEETFKTHPNHQLYEKFVAEGSMILTQGNIVDYNWIIQKMQELRENFNLIGVYYDSWNSSQWAIQCTEMNFPMEPFSQSIGNFNGPTKRFEEIIKNGDAVIEKSSCFLWQVGNAELTQDHNGNCKVTKNSYGKKVDSVISSTTALGGYLKNPTEGAFEIYAL